MKTDPTLVPAKSHRARMLRLEGLWDRILADPFDLILSASVIYLLTECGVKVTHWLLS